MRCKVCLHPKRSEIERQIAARAMNTVEAAKIIGCHSSTVSRHMRHCVAPNVRDRLQAEVKEFQSLNILNQLEKSLQVTLKIRDATESKRQYRVTLKALEVQVKKLEFAAKLTGQLNEAPQVNFLLSPTYVQIKQVMMRVLEPYPDVREAMAQALLDAEAANKEAGNVDDTANDSVGARNDRDNDSNNGQSK
jgi:hypothetical protein